MTTEHMLLLLAALQAADVLSTLLAFKAGATEANPVMARVIKALGTVPGLVLPKVIYGALVWYFRAYMPVTAIWIVCALYAVVVANNLRISMSVATASAKDTHDH